MSKYLVNKFMHRVNMNEAAENEYIRDPAAFVAKWEKGEGHQLSKEERTALEQRDYEKLYAMGAHPFLLWSFTEAVWVKDKPRDELVKDYKEKTRVIGYPDFKT